MARVPPSPSAQPPTLQAALALGLSPGPAAAMQLQGLRSPRIEGGRSAWGAPGEEPRRSAGPSEDGSTQPRGGGGPGRTSAQPRTSAVRSSSAAGGSRQRVMMKIRGANMMRKFKDFLKEPVDDEREDDLLEGFQSTQQALKQQETGLRQVAWQDSGGPQDKAKAPLACDSGSQSFHELLQRLASVHDSEVEEVRALRRDNATLRAALGPRSKVLTTTATASRPGTSNRGPSTVAVQGVPASSSNQEGIRPAVTVAMIEPHTSPTAGTPVVDMVGEEDDEVRSSNSDDGAPAAAEPDHGELAGPDVPPDQELQFQLQAHWLKGGHHQDHSKSVSNEASYMGMNSIWGALTQDPDPEDEESHKGSNSWFPQYPNSQSRILWDCVGAAMVIYDVVMLPLAVFKFPRNDFVISMDWITLIFWTINMPASLCVGYVANGHMVMDMRRILLHYLKTWFILDVLILVPDWTFIIINGGSDEESVGQSHTGVVRVLRLSRMARLVRLMKLRRFLQSVYYAIESEYVSIITHIVQMIALVLAFCHLIGCMWFLVADEQDGPTWVNVNGYDEEVWSYQYALAFHWSITQFTPSTNDIAPKNMAERVTAICVVVFALVGFAYIVGSITGSLTQLRSLSEGSAKMFWDLRRYLTHFRVQPTLALRIEKYLEHAWARQQKGIHSKRVRLLAMLSEPLMRELDLEIYMPSLKVHPLLLNLSEASPLTMQRMAHSAIRENKAARHDLLFVPSEPAANMFFRVSGKLWYQPVGEQQGTFVSQTEEGWVAEPVLWVNAWDHKGALTAATDCDLLMVDPVQFSFVVTRSPRPYEMAVQYARAFVKWLRIHAQGEASTSTGEVLTRSDLASGGFEQIWMQSAKLNWANTRGLPSRSRVGLGLRGFSKAW